MAVDLRPVAQLHGVGHRRRLIVKEHLAEKAGYSMPLLLNAADLKVRNSTRPRTSARRPAC